MVRVLVACEYSATVRDAFAAQGFDAWSCDIVPSEKGGQHIQGDVLDILADGWDLMVAHPPCQYLSYAGIGHWHKPGRAEKREAAAAFFMQMVHAPIPLICIENPRGVMSQWYRRPDQTIDPWMFGDPARKRTDLWLIGLPPLEWYPIGSFWQTAVPAPGPISRDEAGTTQPGKARYFADFVRDPRERARFFPSVARAMAEQWGRYLLHIHKVEATR
jgi:hypothetical protein